MSDEPKVYTAFDPEETPNALADVVGMNQVVLDGPPIAPETLGETFTDPETGTHRHVPAREDGLPVQIDDGSRRKPWLEVQGHGREHQAVSRGEATETEETK